MSQRGRSKMRRRRRKREERGRSKMRRKKMSRLGDLMTCNFYFLKCDRNQLMLYVIPPRPKL